MTSCADLALTGSAGAAPALRAVDCYASQTAASGFGRLFGAEGALLPALTIILTLYIAFFAISLLTGRSRIGVAALTPRMMTLGLVLTFATSWVAYQGVVWNLTVGAPDQLAGILAGTSGPATLIFADKLDIVFGAIADAASAAGQGGDAGGSAAGAGGSMFTSANLMWIAALILLLGTVGVLVTARIALAILLALGPIFVVLALFSGTRGLFVGWLRGVAMTAMAPLFVVLGGGLMLELMVPVIAGLSDGVGINGQAAIALFLIACVHMALTAMVMRVAATLVSGWQVFGLAGRAEERGSSPMPQSSPAQQALLRTAAIVPAAPVATVRQQQAVAAMGGAMMSRDTAPPATIRASRTTIVPAAPASSVSLARMPAARARGIGSGFRARPSQFRETRK